jgi:hypothetical protein
MKKTVYLPAEYREPFLSAVGPDDFAFGTEGSDENLPPLTEYQTQDGTIQVASLGADFFQRLAVDGSTQNLALPLQDPHAARAARLVHALGFSFSRIDPQGPTLILQRWESQPSNQPAAQDYPLAQETSAEYEKQLQSVMHPTEHKGGSSVEEIRSTWYERASKLSQESVYLWSERYWRFRMLGSTCPIFLTSAQIEEWRESSQRVLNKLHDAVGKVANDPELRNHILGSDAEVPTHFPLLARFDGSLQPEGPSFFELNVGAIGFSDTDRTGAIYRSLGLEEGLSASVLPIFSHLRDAILTLHDKSTPPVLAIPVAKAQEPAYASGLLAYAKLIQQAGWQAIYTPLRDLSYQDGKLTHNSGQTVDLVARAYFPGSAGTEHVDQAIADGAVQLVNPPAAHGNKGLFELLDDPTIPWTRIVTDAESAGPDGKEVSVSRYALEHRESLVLKPSDGYGGRDVLLGNKTSPEKWEEAVKRAVEDYPSGRRSVVQVCTAMPSHEFYDRHGQFGNMFWDLNAFVFNGKFGGLAARLSSSTMTNISLGGGAVPIYQV